MDESGSSIYTDVVPTSCMDAAYPTRPASLSIPPVAFSRVDTPRNYYYGHPPNNRLTSVPEGRKRRQCGARALPPAGPHAAAPTGRLAYLRVAGSLTARRLTTWSTPPSIGSPPSAPGVWTVAPGRGRCLDIEYMDIPIHGHWAAGGRDRSPLTWALTGWALTFPCCFRRRCVGAANPQHRLWWPRKNLTSSPACQPLHNPCGLLSRGRAPELLLPASSQQPPDQRT